MYPRYTHHLFSYRDKFTSLSLHIIPHLMDILCPSKGLALDPQNAAAKNAKSVLARAQAFLQKLHVCERTIHSNPNDINAHLGRADALYNLGRYEEALFAYERVISFTPHDAHVHACKAAVLYELEKYAEAIVACDQSIALNHRNDHPYAIKRDALDKTGRYEEAVVPAAKVIAYTQNNGAAYHKLGLLLEQLGRDEEAQKSYAMAKSLGYRG
jgi:tetratricopeptide (TPR) repeat protein